MNGFRNRLVSFALAMIIAAFSLPLSAVAQKPSPSGYSYQSDDYITDSFSCVNQEAVSKEMKEKAGLGILEIESLREECSKHFQLDDGSYQAIAYGMAVHRKDDDGNWYDIDNRMIEFSLSDHMC